MFISIYYIIRPDLNGLKGKSLVASKEKLIKYFSK